jgi:hypothetical protein
MKKILTIFSVLMAFGMMTFMSSAQNLVTIGTNSNTSYPAYFPFNYYWYSTISESLYTQSDILGGGWVGGSGKIESMAWNVTIARTYTNGNITIMMRNSTDNSMVSGPITPDNLFTEVWSGPAPQFNVLGWKALVLNSPFPYDGTGLHIKILKAGNGYSGSYPQFAKTSQNPYRFRADYSDVPITTIIGWNRLDTYTFRPDIQLKICNASASIVDFNVPEFVNIPGSIPVNFSVARPEGDFTATVTIRLYDLQNNLIALLPAEAISISESNGIYNGSGLVNIPAGMVPPGYYKVHVTFNTMDQCNNLVDEIMQESILVLPTGSVPCIVWPGDVNNDGLCNFGDRKALTNYIHDANLQASWLQGPARYRGDAGSNPLTYIEWTAQAAVPWITPEGCYMDTDGNGQVNNFDFIAIKMNWMRNHDAGSGKDGIAFSAETFGLAQNFPNPFNPETTIQYAVPENSSIQLRVYNAAGVMVSELVNKANQATGIHTVKFGADELASGTYIAVINMVGNESGASFSKSIKMTLSK